MELIPSQFISNLEKYSYKGVDKSFFSRYVLSPYWNWLITLWPRSVAPNTITLTGLSIVFLNFISLLYYDREYLTQKHGAPSPPPNWLYFTWAIGLFAYQSLDAIDGKQARRTSMAGPLGEMFDHGCDALNTTLEVILASYALNLGRSWWTVASLIATHANFYLTTWEEYHTGQLYLGVFSGPVEGIIMIITIYIFTGIFGPAFWDQTLGTFLPFLYHLPPKVHVPFLNMPLHGLPLNVVFMLFGGACLAFNIITSYHNVARSRRSSHSYTEGHGSILHPLLLLLPFLFPPFAHLLWLSQSRSAPSPILHSPLFLPFISAWGLQFAHQVGRMILSHVTKMPFPMWDNIWLVTLLGALDASLPRLFGIRPLIQYDRPRTAALVYFALLVSVFIYTRFCYKVIREVTEYLGIACFTVRKKDEKGVWRRAADVTSAIQMNGSSHGASANGLHNGLNGYTNGYTNGHTNGHANGHHTNGLLPVGGKRKM
ncbi:Choline/ethanolaminephosphotransferase [Amanita rubescens]|nr:Choline/ethanolaminephosphotransferase [Amanita rubescens]